jgi:hypothetical protein
MPKPSMVFVFDSFALGLYVAGITYLARGESRPERPTRWALLLLALPVAWSVIVCCWLPSASTETFAPVAFFSLLQLGWMAWLLVPLWRRTERSIGRVVSGLLAGIVLVDAVALAPLVAWDALLLLPLFPAALLLQRFVPAT